MNVKMGGLKASQRIHPTSHIRDYPCSIEPQITFFPPQKQENEQRKHVFPCRCSLHCPKIQHTITSYQLNAPSFNLSSPLPLIVTSTKGPNCVHGG